MLAIVLVVAAFTTGNTSQLRPAVPANEARYFFILYGGQSVPYRPRTAHTWATFVKATPGSDGATAVESVTISWLPAVGPVKPGRLLPERGKNHSLDETFAIAARDNSQVSVWGPFEIDARRYDLAVAQARYLESGAARYRVIDTLGFRESIVHCVHAITYADPVLRRAIQPVVQVGEPGTSRLAARYNRIGAYVGGPVRHDWVLTAIGGDQYPVIRREPGENIPRRWVR